MTPHFTPRDFTPPSTAAALFIRSKDEELKAAYERIKMLEADLLECRNYIECDVDIIDGEFGPLPNKAMRLVSMIDESIHGPGNF